jgi:hypothetical protein
MVVSLLLEIGLKRRWPSGSVGWDVSVPDIEGARLKGSRHGLTGEQYFMIMSVYYVGFVCRHTPLA